MKKLFLFLAVASTSMFVSCSDDDSKDGGETIDPNAATQIVLAANVTEIELGESVTFTVTDNNADVVTSSSSILVNDVEIDGATFTPDVAGTFTVQANHTNTNDLVLESNEITIVVSEAVVVVTASDSFVIDNVNYETSIAGFGFRGIYNAATAGEYIIVWDFNPYFEDGTEYPNDLYLTMISAITPSGTDPDTGEPTFTVENPTTGSYTFTTNVPGIDDVWIVANNVNILPEDTAERAALIQGVTLDITALTFAENEGDMSNLEATYSISLTDGTVITGEYSGETGSYDATPQERAIKNVKAKVAKKQIKNFKSISSKR
ncbi:hypothetical protein [Flavobacterium sp. SM2513]|uniref:hypothetical protein n=1 Tax=Flavobacterium sp. SM2513 TaxID=3424766 RepID=UPI003D7FCFDB